MLIKEIVFQLKDGRDAVLRSPKHEDVTGMLDYLYISSGETDFIVRCPEECGRYTAEEERLLFDRFNASDHEAMLVCLVGGRVVGNAQITWSTYLKTKHRAEIGIALLKAYWDLGIGTQLLSELLRIAQHEPNLLQIELEYIEGNTRARALYEKMGFRITGVKPDAIRLKDGTLLNVYEMVRRIER